MYSLSIIQTENKSSEEDVVHHKKYIPTIIIIVEFDQG